MKKIILLLLVVSFISCNDDEKEMTNLGQTEADIISYIEANNLVAERTEAGVYYVTETKGEGKTPDSDAYVKVNYKAYLLDGSVFDQSEAEGISFDLLNLIPGFKDGIVNFNVGGKGTIIMPPSLAYGDSGISGVIPGGAIIIFDIEIISVINAENEADIIEYIEVNELDTERTESGLYYTIENIGEGDAISENSTITVKYEGYLSNGTVFDSTDDAGFTMQVNELIPGFSEGIQLFNEGGKGKLIIPPNLAYGEDGITDVIPRSAILIFDVEVLTVHN